MTPRLRVLVGPDPSSLQPVTSLVNSGKAFKIQSEAFDGELALFIKGFPGEDANDTAAADAYFDAPDRKGKTWSIQVRGALPLFHLAVCAS
jgi:hypothetical protein